MFGTLRLALALIVVLSHLWLPHYIGHYAVFSFYVLSGFLMTLVMNRVYGFTIGGRLRFAANRVLRIFPAYWCASLLSLALIAVLGPDPAAFLNQAIRVPDLFGSWLANLSLVGLGAHTPSRLVPPAWALAVELAFYAVIAAGLGRSRLTAGAWVLASLMLTFWWIATDTPYSTRYLSVLAGSLPFSLGCLLFHVNSICRALAHPAIRICSIAAYTANLVMAYWLGSTEGLSFYASLLLSVVLVSSLVPVRSAGRLMPRIDRVLGQLSYPVYLLHWQAATIAWVLTGVSSRSATLFLLTLPLVLALATLVNHFVEVPVDAVRTRVKRYSPQLNRSTRRRSKVLST